MAGLTVCDYCLANDNKFVKAGWRIIVEDKVNDDVDTMSMADACHEHVTTLVESYLTAYKDHPDFYRICFERLSGQPEERM